LFENSLEFGPDGAMVGLVVVGNERGKELRPVGLIEGPGGFN